MAGARVCERCSWLLRQRDRDFLGGGKNPRCKNTVSTGLNDMVYESL